MQCKITAQSWISLDFTAGIGLDNPGHCTTDEGAPGATLQDTYPSTLAWVIFATEESG